MRGFFKFFGGGGGAGADLAGEFFAGSSAKRFVLCYKQFEREKKNIFVIVPGGLLLLSLEDVEDDSEPFLDFLNLVEYL